MLLPSANNKYANGSAWLFGGLLSLYLPFTNLKKDITSIKTSIPFTLFGASVLVHLLVAIHLHSHSNPTRQAQGGVTTDHKLIIGLTSHKNTPLTCIRTADGRGESSCSQQWFVQAHVPLPMQQNHHCKCYCVTLRCQERG